MPSNQIISISRSLLLGAFALFTTGFTDCSEFGTVTVPNRDYVDPRAYIGYYYNGHTEISNQLVLKDANADARLVGSGMDQGGVRALELSTITEIHCCSSATACFGFYDEIGGGKFKTLFQKQRDQQSGRWGSRVSNGIWLGKQVQPKALIETYCPTGTNVRYSSVQVSLMVDTEDFAGNEADQTVWVTYNSPNYAGTPPFYVFLGHQVFSP